MKNIDANLTVKEILKENKIVSNWIDNYRLKNEYNPIALKEYNTKFETEFNHFLNNSNLSSETIELFETI